ncbi:MAG: hypothetical protein H0V41_18710 [Pseudonocardiales bacterium]|nr:hypothetical protein [Pseudonocardiales bacterium]
MPDVTDTVSDLVLRLAAGSWPTATPYRRRGARIVRCRSRSRPAPTVMTGTQARRGATPPVLRLSRLLYYHLAVAR